MTRSGVAWRACLLALSALSASAARGGDILIVGGVQNTAAESICTPLYGPLMKEPGWGKVRLVPNGGYSAISQLSRSDLDGARLVIVGPGERYALDAHDRDVMGLLVEYVRQGGGLVVLNTYGQMFAKTEFNYQLMQAFGGRVLLEKVCVPKERGRRIGEYYPDTFASTDRVFPPFSDGVTNVLFCSYYAFGCDHGVVPFLPTKDWKVALSAGLDVPSEPFPSVGLELVDSRRRAKGFDGDTPIVGVREFGRGRVVWFGSSLVLTRPIQSDATREIAERILFRGPEGGTPVETGRFIRNLFNWAGANADGVDPSKLPAVEPRSVAEKRQGTEWKLFKGVVGPRTNLSSGRSSPEEFIVKAKGMGLDFIVFLEDFARLSPERYERLRDICAKASDDRFTAWPGYAFRKDDGNCQYAFSAEPLYPGAKWLTPDRTRFVSMQKAKSPDLGMAGNIDLSFFYGVLSFENNHGWHMFHESPYRQTDNRNVQSMGVITRVDGRTTETAFDAYRINNRNGQMLLPFALELLSSADGLDENTYLSVIGMNGIAAFRRLMMSHGCHNGYPREGNYGCQSVSNGPEIEFRPKRGDYGCDEKLLYSERYLDWPYTLDVSSANGVAWVEVLDGDRIVRHWDAGGAKKFKRRGSFAVERQHYLWVRAKDVGGKAAFTRSCNSESFLMRECQCNDRNNMLFYSDQPRGKTGERYYCAIGADTCTPDKGPWNGRVRPVGFFVFDKKYGLGGDGGHDGSPEDHPQVSLVPSIEYGGVASKRIGWVREFVSGREGGPHCRPERVVASADALVGDRVLDGVFAFDRRPVIHVWHSLFPVYDSRYADTRARCTLFLPKLDGVVPYQWEQTLVLRQPVPSEAGKPIVNFGSLRLSSKHTAATACLSGRRVDGIAGRSFSMNPGDCLVVENPVYGSLAVFPLSPIGFDRNSFNVLGDGGVYAVGSEFSCRMVLMGMNKFVGDPVSFAVAAGKAYGIGGGEPAYRAELSHGSGRPNGVCFDAVADHGALAGRFVGLSRLPGTLGLRLSGLTSCWSVAVQSGSGVRLVPVEEGTAYVALREEESDAPIFAGHPFRAGDRDLVLSLSRPGRWMLEVHNPTGREISTRVESDPRCTAFSFCRDMTVPAGASIDVELQ